MTSKTDDEKVQEVLSEREDDLCLRVTSSSTGQVIEIQRINLEHTPSTGIARNLSNQGPHLFKVLLPFKSLDGVEFYPKDSND